MSEADRVARVLAAATAGRGLNAKIPERIVPAASVERRSQVDSRQRDRDADARGTANRTGPTYKAHSSIAHQVTTKSAVKPLDRVQQDARALASGNACKDRRSIDQVQRELKGAPAVDDERDFFDGPSSSSSRKMGKASSSSSSGKKRAAETRTPGDASLIINKMGLIADDHRSFSRDTVRSNGDRPTPKSGPSSVPSKRRRRSVTPSDASDDSAAAQEDFDSDDLDDVDVRRKKKKKQASTIGAASRRREEGSGRRPMGGSVLAAAGLDIYAMFGRKDRELYVRPLTRSTFSLSTNGYLMPATSRATVIRIRKTTWRPMRRRSGRRRPGRRGRRGRMIDGRRLRSGGAPRRSGGGRSGDDKCRLWAWVRKVRLWSAVRSLLYRFIMHLCMSNSLRFCVTDFSLAFERYAGWRTICLQISLLHCNNQRAATNCCDCYRYRYSDEYVVQCLHINRITCIAECHSVGFSQTVMDS